LSSVGAECAKLVKFPVEVTMAQQLYEISINQHDQSGNFFMSRLMYAITESGNEDFWKLANDFIAAWSLANETAWLKLQGADVVLDY
jgi:hypothetical protein